MVFKAVEEEVTRAGAEEKRNGLEQNLRNIRQLWKRCLHQELKGERGE